jgi:hypothetical protein
MRKLSPDEADEFYDTYTDMTGKLYDAIVEYETDQQLEDENFRGADLGGDSFGDLIAHIVGLGKREFDAVMRNPQRAIDRAHRGDFKESFAYAIPSKRDYAKLDIKPYLKWAERNLDAYKMVLKADADDVPFKSKITPPLQFLMRAFQDFVRSRNIHEFMEQDDKIRKAAEDVDQTLSRLGFGARLTDEGPLEDALKVVSNKWATWNLLTDIRNYLT